MNKFFIENPYLEGQLDLNEDNGERGRPQGKDYAEDQADGIGMLGNTHKYWESISKEVAIG